MRTLFVLAFLIFIDLMITAQSPVGSWTDHLSYNSANRIAVSNTEVFASTGSGIIIYDSQYNEVRRLSKVNGLSESGISTLGYSNENNILIIGYESANIDLVKDNLIINIPDIKLKNLPGEKKINNIYSDGRYAYVSFSFGIVVIDLIRKEIIDTWKPGSSSETNEVNDIITKNNQVIATTNNGAFYADFNLHGLSYYGNWKRIEQLPSPEARYTHIISQGNRIFINRSDGTLTGDTVYLVEDECSVFTSEEGVFYTSFSSFSSGFVFTSSDYISIYNSDGSIIKRTGSYGWGAADPYHAIVDGNRIWIADNKSGLVEGVDFNSFVKHVPPGPSTNEVYNISNGGGRIFFPAGGVTGSWMSLMRQGQINSFENNSWTTLLPDNINDILRVLPEPGNPNHFFASSWGGGLLEFTGNDLKNRFDAGSYSLSQIPGQLSALQNNLIAGMAFDREKNLWITRSGVAGNISILKPDGTWIKNPLTIDAPVVGELIIAESGYKWIILPGGNGIFIFDDNNTPSDFSDDRSRRITVKDYDGNLLSHVYSIKEDLDGNIWIGTDQGPAIFNDPGNIFGEDPRATRVKIARADGTGLADFMLGKETITSIAVDGANRKWLGTLTSGLYLLSPDGTTLLKNYNEKNSPLLSDFVKSVLADGETGEIWVGTDKGIVSLRGDATTGASTYNKIYSFPNPVREDFTGNVTITGLMGNSLIKITDISGNLVFETQSVGGQASWDLTTYNGTRVATGVYIVFCSNPDGSQSAVTKMVVVK